MDENEKGGAKESVFLNTSGRKAARERERER